MSEKVINEAVEVLARTSKGEIIPELVTWKGKNFTVAAIEGRRRRSIGKKRHDIIKVRLLVLCGAELEFNYSNKTWKLLTVERLFE